MNNKGAVIGALLGLWAVSQPSVSMADVQAGRAGDVGLGAILGSPTGLSFKYWMSQMTAIDAAAAWHFGDEDRFQFHADHLWHIDINRLSIPDSRLPVYVGVGGRVLTGHDAEVG